MTYHKLKELLNKRSELLCKCHHASKFFFKYCTGNDFSNSLKKNKVNCLRFKILFNVKTEIKYYYLIIGNT